MTVRAKLIVIILVVALVPLGISAWTALRGHRSAFDPLLAELHERTADSAAARVVTTLDRVIASLDPLITRSIDWPRLSEPEREGAMALLYGQTDEIVVVSVLDATGRGVGPSVYRETGSTESSHPAATPALLERFAASLSDAPARGEHVGRPFRAPHLDTPIVPLFFAVEGADGEPWLVAVGLSLRAVCESLAGVAPELDLVLVDAGGRSLCSSPDEVTFDVAAALAQHEGAGGSLLRVDDGSGTELLAALATPGFGWQVIAAQPAARAFARSHELRRHILYWIAIGAIGALTAGVFLARELTRPIASLAQGAREIEAGNLTHRIELERSDELGELGDAFNAMSEEIAEWRAQLEARVEDRTRELRDAQAQLLESRKIAAVASLGAGFAHEINNPLTTILAFAQVLHARAAAVPERAKEARMLAGIESEAQRIRAIVDDVQRLSRDHTREGRARISLAEVVDDALSAEAEAIAAASIELERDCDSDAPRVLGSSTQLAEALRQIIDNAVKAMRGPTRRLLVRVRAIDGELVEVAVSDTGGGIPDELRDKLFEPFATNKSHWEGRGLGLSLAYRIVEAHNGRILYESSPDDGTTMKIVLPAARRGALLA